MMRYVNRRGLRLLMTLLVAAVLWPAGCDHGPDRERLPRMDRLDLVSDLELTLHCSDASAFTAAMARSPLGRLWSGPEMAALRNGWRIEDLVEAALGEETRGGHAAKIGDIYVEQFKMLKGEIVLGLDFSRFDRRPAVTLAAAMSAEDYRRSLEMDVLLFDLMDEDTLTASEDFRGIAITTYLTREEDGDRFMYQAFYDGTLLASEDRPWLEKSLIRLMETPAREPVGDPVVTVTGGARLMDRLQSFVAAKAGESGSPFDVQTLIHGLGIDSVGDLKLDVCLREDRADLAFQAARRGEWDRGVMVLIPADPAPLDLRLAHVPPDVVGYQVFRMDLNALWMQIPEILRRLSPDFQMQFTMGVNAAGGMMGIDLNEEIFGNLDRLGFTYARLGDHGQELVYGIRVKDAGAMERTLEKFFAEQSPVQAQLGEAYRRTDVQGRGVHMLQFPVPSGRGDEMVMQDIGLTVVDRALVIGKGSLLVDHVQAAVHHQGPPDFYSSPMFTAMTANLPANACSYGVSDLAAYAGYLTEEFRKGAEAMQGAFAAPASTESDRRASAPLADVLAGLDVDKLPSSASVARYFGTSDGYSVIDAAGFRSTMTIHYPER